MTDSTSSSTDFSEFPTEWRHVDLLNNTEVRQFSDDTYELRSPSHSVMITHEEFDLYRINVPAFERLLEARNRTASIREITQYGQS